MSDAQGRAYLVHGEQCGDMAATVTNGPWSGRLMVVTLVRFFEVPALAEHDRVIVCGSPSEIKRVFRRAADEGFIVTVLPQRLQNTLRATFDIPSDMDAALEQALENKPKWLDLLYANDEIVLWGALVGDAPPLTYSSVLCWEASFRQRLILLREAFAKLGGLRQSELRLRTAKGQEVKTAAVGMVVIEHDNRTSAAGLVKNHLSPVDGKLAALLLSPTSIADYLRYLYVALFHRPRKDRLPNSVGLIKSERLFVESQPARPVRIDGERVMQTPVEFSVHPRALRFVAGDAFWQAAVTDHSEKETLRLGTLPAGGEEVEYIKNKRLPLFTHASEDRYKDASSEKFVGALRRRQIAKCMI